MHATHYRDWETKKKFLKMGGKTQKIPESGWLAPTAAKVKTVLTYPPPVPAPPSAKNFHSFLWCWSCSALFKFQFLVVLVMHRVFQPGVFKGPFPSYDSNFNLIAAEQYYMEEFNGALVPVPEKTAHMVIA